MSLLPPDLVHHVARELIERSRDIKHAAALVREISPHPLPVSAFAELNLPLSQWQLGESNPSSLWQKLNPFATKIQTVDLNQLNQTAQPAAALVFAPFVLDAYADVLDALKQLPNWFSDDGVLLFATLGAGGLPEIVNAQPEWLDVLSHWPNIMDAGARLQDLRFGLPVLDVETVDLSYSDFDALWADVQAFVPNANNATWRNRLHELYAQGLRQISLQVMYGQVWQVQAARHASDTHTVSLESLMAQLPHRKTFGDGS